MKKIVNLVLISLLLFGVSCRKNDDENSSGFVPKGPYEYGYLVANEGNYGNKNASVSFISKDLSSITNDIYASNNAKQPLGDVLQSITFKDDHAFLVLNNSNKVVVVNRYTMAKKAEITSNLIGPNYVAIYANFIYVTNDAYGKPKSVSIYNASDYSFVKKIDFNGIANRIVEAGGNLFVQNASFGSGNKISYISSSDNTLKGSMSVPNGAIEKIISKDNMVYAIASGNTDSYIYQISSEGSITKTITLTGIPSAKNLELYEGNFYFTAANKAYSMPMASNTAPTSSIFSVKDSIPFYGFNVIDGRIFVPDVNNFSGNSSVMVYSLTGSLLKTLTSGVGTNSFYTN